MAIPTEFFFNVRLGNQTEIVTSADLKEYAEVTGLERYASGRYSWLFVLNLLSYDRLFGISPFQVIDEIRALEDSSRVTRTKAASQFTREPLKGLWHKHFFCARFLANNVLNHLARGGLEKLAAEVFDTAKSPVITKEMIQEFSHRVVVGSFEQRASEGKMTGEWIIFAKHEERNFYLSLATHGTGDESIINNIRAVVWPQFPFLDSSRCT